MLPGVKIIIGNGNLGRIKSTSDSVAGMILTGTAVAGKLELNKHYQLSSTSDLATLGVDKESNYLVDKECRAFFAQVGEGAELHLMVMPQATTLTAICDAGVDSALSKLILSAGGRIRIVGVNKIAPEEYSTESDQCIDSDCVTAIAAAHQCAEGFTEKIMPFRVLLPACAWNGQTENLYKPSEASYNRVGVVLASDDKTKKSAAIGQILGRAASLSVHQSLGRVRSGAIAPEGWSTDGNTYLNTMKTADLLHDAGYIFYMKYPTKNGCYLNGDPMAASPTDDYSSLYLGRTTDKAFMLIYDTYISEIMDNVSVDDKGKLPAGITHHYSSIIESVINKSMSNEISSFTCTVDPDQDVLATKSVIIEGSLVPKGVVEIINFKFQLSNPQLK